MHVLKVYNFLHCSRSCIVHPHVSFVFRVIQTVQTSEDVMMWSDFNCQRPN